jgi:hypothetical protein
MKMRALKDGDDVSGAALDVLLAGFEAQVTTE